MAIVSADADLATKRKAVSTLVRYATPKGVQRPGDLRTAGVAALDGTAPNRGDIHHEHVVPVRLMVDRIVGGDDPAAVLAAAVVAHVLSAEHRQIGPLVTRHAELYRQMKVAAIVDISQLALQRYTRTNLTLHEVPDVVDPANELRLDV